MKFLEDAYAQALYTGLRPSEFWQTTPAELAAIATAFYKLERDRQKESWRQAAFIASFIANYAGKVSKRTVSPDQLVRFADEKKGMPDEKELRQAILDDLKEHKKRAWMKIRGGSLGDIKIFGEGDGKNS